MNELNKIRDSAQEHDSRRPRAVSTPLNLNPNRLALNLVASVPLLSKHQGSAISCDSTECTGDLRLRHLQRCSGSILGQSLRGSGESANHEENIATLWRPLCVAHCETSRRYASSAAIQVSRTKLGSLPNSHVFRKAGRKMKHERTRP